MGGLRGAFQRLSSSGAVLLILLIAAFALRVYSAYLPLWFDELASVYFAHQPLGNLWSSWMVRETNPPLYYTILKAWLAVSPYDLFFLRLPTILAGVGAIWVCHRTVRLMHSRGAADIVALLLTLSSVQIFYSHEMRGYIFAFLAVAIALHGLVAWLDGLKQGENRTAPMLLYALGTLAAIYCHTTLILWPAAATAALVLVCWPDWRRDPRLLVTIILWNALILIGSAWWLYMVFLQMTGPSKYNLAWMKPMGIVDIYRTLRTSIFLSGGPWMDKWAVRVSMLVQFLLIGAVVWSMIRGLGDRKRMLVALCLIFSVILFLIVQTKAVVVATRTLLWLNVLVAILAAMGLADLPGKLVRRIVVALLAVMMVYNCIVIEREGRDLRVRTEDWVSSADRMLPVPNAAVIVLNPAVATLAGVACEISAKGAPCPYKIIMIEDPKLKFDYWSWGLVKPLPIDQLDEALLAYPNVFLFNRLAYNPLPLVEQHGICLPAGSDNGRNLIGPLHFARTKGKGGCALTGS